MHWIFLIVMSPLAITASYYIARFFVKRKWVPDYGIFYSACLVGLGVVAWLTFGPWLHWKS